MRPKGAALTKAALLGAVLGPLLAAAALPLSANAATPVKILGFDDMSCQAWTQARGNDEQRELYLAWLRGVLTGHNYARPAQQVSVVSKGTLENYVTRYYRERPTGNIADAVFRMSDDFSGRNAPVK